MNKLGNVEIIGNIQFGDKTFTVNDLIQKIDSNGDKKIDTILFKVPELLNETQYAHFKIEFSTSDKFEEENITRIINTSDPTTVNTVFQDNNSGSTILGLKVFTGMQMVDFPGEGLGFQFSKEMVKLDISNITGNFYRFQWLIGDRSIEDDELIPSRYGYGQISGIISVFDDL